MIVLLTDFGLTDPYVGQMKGVLLDQVPDQQLIDLCHQLPDFDPRAAAYFIPAYAQYFPASTVFVCVVDPGVGSERAGCVIQVDQHWFVGPDNGLFSQLIRRGSHVQCWHIPDSNTPISASFHGRDVFAPTAARVARGEMDDLEVIAKDDLVMPDWPDDLNEIIYIDHYGNLITGFRYQSLPENCQLSVSGQIVTPARTFADVPLGQLFYYENANGLLEIAANQASAAEALGAVCGDEVVIS